MITSSHRGNNESTSCYETCPCALQVGRVGWCSGKHMGPGAAGGAVVELQHVIYTVDGVKMKGSEVCVSFLGLTFFELCPRYQTNFH